MFDKSKILLLVVFALSGMFNFNLGHSQTIIHPENPKENIFRVRTKQFNEFIDRFNYKINFKGDPIDSLFKEKIPRDKLINSLFDLKDPRIEPSDKIYSKKYVDEKKEFINEAVHRNLIINIHSDKIIAEARSPVLFKETPNSITIFLNQELAGEGKVKWVIINVKGDIFDFLKTDTAFAGFIPPSSNETDFMNLKRALDDTDHLQYFAAKNYHPDNLTLFFFMVNTGLLKFKYVEEVNYHIFDIPGWYIKVKEFNRLEMNSGWLITDIRKTTSGEANYLKAIDF